VRVPLRPAGVAVLASALTAIGLVGCGSDSPGTAPAQSVFPITLTRTGGIAGFHDKAVIASDGAVDLTTKQGRRQCTLDPTVLAAVGGAASAITGTAATTPAHPDDLVVIVTTGRGSARVEDSVLATVSGELGRLLDPKQTSAVCR
jgi:hypothetical protein